MFNSSGSLDPLQRQDVWESFVAGDHSCFKMLFQKYYQEMFGYGLKLGGNQELVKDCIQDLFKTIWERRDELDHIDSPNVYLFVSLRRKIITALKKEDKTGAALSELDETDFLSFGMEEIIITDEIKHKNKRKLQKALNQLSNRQKEVIYLHFYNGMSYGEIEKILSINRQSVRNHVYRAMETLRTVLDNEIMKLVISMLVCFLYFLP